MTTGTEPYRGERVDSATIGHAVMPLGGIGTGNLAIGADGSLRQFQLHNIGNHEGTLPGTFFAIRATRWEPPLDTVRILQAGPIPASTGTPLVTDDVAPRWQHDLLAQHPGVESTTFRSTYPFAEINYHDPALPVQVTLEAFNPLVPHDVPASSIPAALFTMRIVNTDSLPIHGSVGVTMQNAVGWDGVSPIDGVAGAGYGGNTNRVLRRAGWTLAVAENALLDPDSPGAGQMVLAVDDPAAPVLAQWRTPAEFMAFLSSRALSTGSFRLATGGNLADPQSHAPRAAAGPSPAGSTWNTGIGVPFLLEPGEERQIRIVLAWYFPNRYLNFEQFGRPHPEWGRSRFFLGNHYATEYLDATDVVDVVAKRWSDLRAASLAWPRTLAASGLTDDAVLHLSGQLSLLRSPTCFRGADGRFYGFEGVLGASTVMWSGAFGGSCPLNCTHVWNYAHAVASAFPELERSMRQTEFEIMQAPEGYLPHRLLVPTYLRQFWGEPIGGPEEPALDGMLGAVLKTYREYLRGAGPAWLRQYWPNLVRLLDHVEARWHTDGTGMLSGVQPSTHDIDLCGLNTFMGTLWLAALRAAQEMAVLVGDPARADHYSSLFALGSANYDAALFNGEYYVQRLLPGDRPDFQWVDGCLADQLIGQWWAHQLGLGHLLPADHVRTALRSVVRYNLRTGFDDFHHGYRVFADGDDTGLLMCTWPTGGRPSVPTRYADEVWTGSEYEVAAHCFWEGMPEQGSAILDGLWGRYDGRRRNPYNEIECGDHYARAMAGHTVLDAMAGFRQDVTAGVIEVRRPETGRSLPIMAAAGTGMVSGTADGVSLRCTGGTVRFRVLKITGSGFTGGAVTTTRGGGMEHQVDQDSVLRCDFGVEVGLGPGEDVAVTFSCGG